MADTRTPQQQLRDCAYAADMIAEDMHKVADEIVTGCETPAQKRYLVEVRHAMRRAQNAKLDLKAAQSEVD